MTGLLDVARQAEQAQLARDASRSRHGLLNNDNPIQRAMRGGSMYGSLMQDPADKARMDRQMLESTLAMMPMAGMTTYHGSPHLFNKFRMDRIGTGEGAQAYGHGLYLAENPNVARQYDEAGNWMAWKIDGKNYHGQTTKIDATPHNTAANALDRFNGDKNKAIQWLEDFGMEGEAKKILRDAKSIKKAEGNLYKVDLPDDQIKNMLDWDAPLSKQPEGIKKQIKNIFDDDYIEHLVEESRYQWNGDLSPLTGKELYQLFKKASRDDFIPPLPIEATRSLGNAERVSEFLKSKGIPGIKYLDQGSRGGGQGTRNFVVFDENIPQILERNQQPIGGLLGK